MNSYDSIFQQKLTQRLEEELTRNRDMLEGAAYTGGSVERLGLELAVRSAEIRTLKSILAWTEEVRVEMNSPEQ